MSAMGEAGKNVEDGFWVIVCIVCAVNEIFDV
jgi:hypothetical protein